MGLKRVAAMADLSSSDDDYVGLDEKPYGIKRVLAVADFADLTDEEASITTPLDEDVWHLQEDEFSEWASVMSEDDGIDSVEFGQFLQPGGYIDSAELCLVYPEKCPQAWNDVVDEADWSVGKYLVVDESLFDSWCRRNPELEELTDSSLWSSSEILNALNDVFFGMRHGGVEMLIVRCSEWCPESSKEDRAVIRSLFALQILWELEMLGNIDCPSPLDFAQSFSEKGGNAFQVINEIATQEAVWPIENVTRTIGSIAHENRLDWFQGICRPIEVL